MTDQDEKNGVLGIIGGSGVYDIDGLGNRRSEKVETPFGMPSDEITLGELAGQRLAYLVYKQRCRRHRCQRYARGLERTIVEDH